MNVFYTSTHTYRLESTAPAGYAAQLRAEGWRTVPGTPRYEVSRRAGIHVLVQCVDYAVFAALRAIEEGRP